MARQKPHTQLQLMVGKAPPPFASERSTLSGQRDSPWDATQSRLSQGGDGEKLPSMGCEPGALEGSVKTRQNGAALIVTLAILSMTFLLVIAFLMTAQTERRIARGSTAHVGACMVAEAGVNQAINLLTEVTKDPNYITYSSNQNWITKQTMHPIVQVYKITTNAWLTPAGVVSADPVHYTNLVSGLGSDSVNLNENGVLASTNTLAYPFQVSWVYVTNGAGQAVGRYAFWILTIEQSRDRLVRAGCFTDLELDRILRMMKTPGFSALGNLHFIVRGRRQPARRAR